MDIEHRLLKTLQKLYKMTDRKTALYIQRDNPTNLTTMQAIVLQYIVSETRTHDVFSRDLENFFVVRSSSVNSMVNFLERGGYIRREPCAEDGRMKRLVVAEETRQIEEWLWGATETYIYDAFEGFSEEEKAELEVLLKKLLKNLTV